MPHCGTRCPFQAFDETLETADVFNLTLAPHVIEVQSLHQTKKVAACFLAADAQFTHLLVGVRARPGASQHKANVQDKQISQTTSKSVLSL